MTNKTSFLMKPTIWCWHTSIHKLVLVKLGVVCSCWTYQLWGWGTGNGLPVASLPRPASPQCSTAGRPSQTPCCVKLLRVHNSRRTLLLGVIDSGPKQPGVQGWQAAASLVGEFPAACSGGELLPRSSVNQTLRVDRFGTRGICPNKLINHG